MRNWIGVSVISLVLAGCRPVCTSDEIRHGDDCVERPDAARVPTQSEEVGDDTDASVPADAYIPPLGVEGPDPMGEFDGSGKVDEPGDVVDAAHSDAGSDAGEPGDVASDAGATWVADAAQGPPLAVTDPCEPNPCGSGFDCVAIAFEGARCIPSCTHDELGCRPGDRCAEDVDCQVGGDANASCEPADHVCVSVCGPTTIVSRSNLEAARYCREIDGDLLLDPSFDSIDASAFPYLVRVRRAVDEGPDRPQRVSVVRERLSANQLEELFRAHAQAQIHQVGSLQSAPGHHHPIPDEHVADPPDIDATSEK